MGWKLNPTLSQTGPGVRKSRGKCKRIDLLPPTGSSLLPPACGQQWMKERGHTAVIPRKSRFNLNLLHSFGQHGDCNLHFIQTLYFPLSAAFRQAGRYGEMRWSFQARGMSWDRIRDSMGMVISVKMVESFNGSDGIITMIGRLCSFELAAAAELSLEVFWMFATVTGGTLRAPIKLNLQTTGTFLSVGRTKWVCVILKTCWI